jgi:hypothetical protein
MLCALEPVKSVRPRRALGGDQAQIGLKPAAHQHAGFGLALAEHPLDGWILDERRHDRLIGARHEDVDVAAGLAAAAQAPDRSNLCGRIQLLQMRHDRLRDRVRRRQQMAAGVLFPLVNGFQDEGFLLGSHPPDRADAAVARGPLEVVERLHPQLAIKRCHRFRSDALQPHHVENRRRKLRHQASVIFRSAGFGDFADPRRQVLADAGDFAQPGRIERRELVRMVGDDVGGVAVRADLERILVLDLEEIGDLLEHARDGVVIQRAAPRSRCDSRADVRRRRPVPRRSRASLRADHSRRGSRRPPRRRPCRLSLRRPRPA